MKPKAAATMKAKPTKTEIISMPMRHWIKQVLQYIGTSKSAAIASPTYVDSAIRIAKFLAMQISQAENLEQKYGISSKLDQLPISADSDWAGNVVVYLESSDGKIHQDENPAALAAHRPSFGANDSNNFKSSNHDSSNAFPTSLENNEANPQDFNAQLGALLKSIERSETAKERCFEQIRRQSVGTYLSHLSAPQPSPQSVGN
jgi:hypothetical protein